MSFDLFIVHIFDNFAHVTYRKSNSFNLFYLMPV